MKPLVSVILPTYNRQHTLQRSVESVMGQSFADWELIIIDDGSTDGTDRTVEKWLGDPRIRYHRTTNGGVSAARNKGIRQAQADWVAFLDSDDVWLPQKNECQLCFADSHPEISLVHGDEIWIRNGVRVNPMRKHQKGGGDVFGNALKLCCISPSTVMLKRDLLLEQGLFREDFPVCEDYDLWLKITSLYNVGFVDQFLIKKYGGHSDQLSHRFVAMDYWRVLAIDDLLDSRLLDPGKQEMASRELGKKAQVLLRGYRKHGNLEFYDRVFEILKKWQKKGRT
ncbi:MAG: glycosyltransferase family A protein [Pseudomonadota bacterium]